jgi:hypothetical protein
MPLVKSQLAIKHLVRSLLIAVVIFLEVRIRVTFRTHISRVLSIEHCTGMQWKSQ